MTKVNYKHLSGASPVAGSKGSACNAGTIGLIPGQEEPLEKSMAAHSGTLAWRIPWTEEPGGLQSMGSQRVGYELSDSAHSQKEKRAAEDEKVGWTTALPIQWIETWANSGRQ